MHRGCSSLSATTQPAQKRQSWRGWPVLLTRLCGSVLWPILSSCCFLLCPSHICTHLQPLRLSWGTWDYPWLWVMSIWETPAAGVRLPLIIPKQTGLDPTCSTSLMACALLGLRWLLWLSRQGKQVTHVSHDGHLTLRVPRETRLSVRFAALQGP